MFKDEEFQKNLVNVVAITIIMTLFADAAHAVTAPAAGSAFYDFYDVGINKILKSAPGFVFGVGSIAFGAINFMQSKMFPGVAAMLGGAALLKADTMVETLGLLF